MKPSRVAIIGTVFPSYERYCPNWSGMIAGLTALGIPHRFLSCRPSLDIDALVEYEPDLVIYGLLDMVRREDWRAQIRARLPNAKIVLWYGDYRDRRTGQIPANLSEVDMMFVSNDAQNAWYEQHWRVPCRYLPLGSPIYDVEPEERFAFDFVFIGGKLAGPAFGARARTIGDYEDAGLKVIDGPSHRPDLRMQVFKNMPAIYRSAKIVLDMSHFTDVARYTSNRHWIITASGGFALTKRFPGCELDYPEGTRAYFDTFEESLELRDYYLAHPAEREKIRIAGYQHAQKHTYENRFGRMFHILYGRSNDENGQEQQGIQASGSPVSEGTSAEPRSSARGTPDARRTRKNRGAKERTHGTL